VTLGSGLWAGQGLDKGLWTGQMVFQALSIFEFSGRLHAQSPPPNTIRRHLQPVGYWRKASMAECIQPLMRGTSTARKMQ
jgi:hypothetical protein